MSHISEIRASQWKNFRFEEPILLAQGVNLLLGKNGSGKTSILEMLQSAAEGSVHSVLFSSEESAVEGTRLASINIKEDATEIVVSNEFRGGDGRWSSNYLKEKIRFITSSRSVTSGNNVKNPFAGPLSVDVATTNVGQVIDVAEEFNKSILKELIDVVKEKVEEGANFLENIQNDYQKELVDFEKELKIDPSQENAVSFIDHRSREIPVNSLSSGEKEYLYFYSYLRRIRDDEGRIILIDEPELHLHSSQIRKLCELIAVLAIKNQVIIATHSGEILQHFISSANLVLLSKDRVERIADAEQMRRVIEETGLPVDPSVFTAHWICAENEPTKTLKGANGPTTPDVLGWIFGKDIKKRYWSFSSNRMLAESYGAGVTVALPAASTMHITLICDGDALIKGPDGYIPTTIPEPNSTQAFFPFWELENIFLMPSILNRLIPAVDRKNGFEVFWDAVVADRERLGMQVKKTIAKKNLRRFSADNYLRNDPQNEFENWKAAVQAHTLDLSSVGSVFDDVISRKDWRWIPGKEALGIVVSIEPTFWDQVRILQQEGNLEECFMSEADVATFIERVVAL